MAAEDSAIPRSILEKAVITAPIDGIVLERSVDVGQTVAATMSSPVLFTIAADLTAMQLQIHADEADIGEMRTGQAVTFTVDAYPGESFTGTTSQVAPVARFPGL